MMMKRPSALVDSTRVVWPSRAISTVTPTFPQTVLDMPYLSTESSSVVPAGEATFKACSSARNLDALPVEE